MTTVGNKAFGSARSVFERNDNRDKPPRSADIRRSTTPFQPPPRVQNTDASVKPSLREGAPHRKHSPNGNARRTYSSSSPSRKQQQTEDPVNSTHLQEAAPPADGVSSRWSAKPTNIPLKATRPELKPMKLKVNNPQHCPSEQKEALDFRIPTPVREETEENERRNRDEPTDLEIEKKVLDEDTKRPREDQTKRPREDHTKRPTEDHTKRPTEELDPNPPISEIHRSSHRKAVKPVDPVSKAAIKIQAIFRGVRQRIISASILEHTRKEKELHQKLKEMNAETNGELLSIRASVQQYKDNLRSKLNQRRAKHKDKTEIYDRNKLEVENLKKDNAQFRTRNDNLKENCRKLRLKNLRLEKSKTTHEEQMAQIQGHHDRCKEDNERLLEVQANYRKKIDQLETSLNTRTAYAVAENRIKQCYRNAIDEYVAMLERSRDRNNKELMANVHRMRNEARKRDKTSDEPCPYEVPLGAGGDPSCDEDSCSSWLHSPPRLSKAISRVTQPGNENKKTMTSPPCLSNIASLPIGSLSSDEDSYVFDDNSSKGGFSKPVAYRKGQSDNSNDHRDEKTNNDNGYEENGNHSTGTDRDSSPLGRSQSGKTSKMTSNVKRDNDGDTTTKTIPEGSNEKADPRHGPSGRKQKVSPHLSPLGGGPQQPHPPKPTVVPNSKSTETKSGRRKPPKLRPTAKKSSQKHEVESSMVEEATTPETVPPKQDTTPTTVVHNDDGSTSSSRSSRSSSSSSSTTGSKGSDADGSGSDDSAKAFDRSYQSSIALAASKLGGGITQKKQHITSRNKKSTPQPTTQPTTQTEPDDDSRGWSSGESDSDSESEMR